MTDQPKATRRPAIPEEVRFALEHALKFDGRRRFSHADGIMAELTAAHLAEQLTKGLFVVMKKPPGGMPSAPPYGDGKGRLTD